MIRVGQWVVRAMLAGALVLPQHGMAAEHEVEPKAIPLKQATEAQVPKAKIAALCRSPCVADSARAYVGTDEAKGKIYLIDNDNAVFIIHDPANDAPGQGTRYWDFSDYAHSQLPLNETGKNRPSIYSALYPVDDRHYAIAYVSDTREMYSGGGASFEVADFLVLEPRLDGLWEKSSYRVQHKRVPFACSKTIRACFTDMHYKTSAHCNDEYAGKLTIRYQRGVDGKVDWWFIWYETSWAANEPKADQKRDITPFAPDSTATALPQAVSFCGGPS